MATNNKVISFNLGAVVHRESTELPMSIIKEAVEFTFLDDNEHFKKGYPIVTNIHRDGKIDIIFKTNKHKDQCFNKTLCINYNNELLSPFKYTCKNLKYKKGVYSWDQNVCYSTMTNIERLEIANQMLNDLVTDTKGYKIRQFI